MRNKFGVPPRAYSLIELSIVLVIISILITGAMSVSVENLKSNQVEVTRDKMATIYKMIGHHIRVTKSLPCPASLTKVKSVDSDYGTALDCSASASNLIWGMVPTASLGLPSEFAEDAFGSKILYFVDKRFTTSPGPILTSVPDFSVNNFSTMGWNQLSPSAVISYLWKIKERPASSLQDVTSYAVFGLVSFGQNKLGSYNANSSSQNSATISDFDESTNANPTTAFVLSSPTSNSFDDIVFYKTFKDIVADYSYVASLVPCKYSDIPDLAGLSAGKYDTTTKNNAWLDGVTYSKTRGTGNTCRYSYRCAFGGVWTTINNNCP